MLSLLAGFFVFSVAHVHEVVDNSNAIGITPTTTQELTQYLDAIDNRATPIVTIDHLYGDYFNSGTEEYVYKFPHAIRKALSDSKHYGRIVFLFDEPLWRARRSGQDPEEVKGIMSQIRADFPGIEFATIYAYAELFNRYIENYGDLKLWYEGEHIGFDCYDPFDACGGGDIPEISQATYLQLLYADKERNGHKAKILATAGAFSGSILEATEEEMVEQLYDYGKVVSENADVVSGLMIFSYSDLNESTFGVPGTIPLQGARDNPALYGASIHVLDMVQNPEKYKIDQN